MTKNKEKLQGRAKEKNKEKWFSTRPVLLIILKSLVIIVGFFLIVRYVDTKGYFNPNEQNNHTKKKWDAYYEFTNNNNVDILLVGNSHLYTGINPKNLSNALGCNTFILASPGTDIADYYYALKEALKKTKAKLVVIETYGIKETNPYELKKGGLSDQFKSFAVRKDFLTKVTSLPFLFRVDNYLYAWSNTLRNHDFIFNDTIQLGLNKKRIHQQKKNEEEKKLFLGRYIRFLTGIEDDVINKYNSLGAPVKGKEYAYNHYTKKYVNKIIALCKQEKIELVFLTLPMYQKHISDYKIWKEKLSDILGKKSIHWMDMQTPNGYKGFGKFAFENTYRKNQHMTYDGSLLATYKLANYIRDTLKIKLPNRSKNSKWTKLFYGKEGYFENFNPVKNDTNNKIICSDKTLRNIKIKCFLHLDITNKKQNKIIGKIDKKLLQNLKYEELKLRIVLRYEMDGKEQTANLDLTYDQFHRPKNDVIFMLEVKPIKVKGIIDGMLIKN